MTHTTYSMYAGLETWNGEASMYKEWHRQNSRKTIAPGETVTVSRWNPRRGEETKTVAMSTDGVIAVLAEKTHYSPSI